MHFFISFANAMVVSCHHEKWSFFIVLFSELEALRRLLFYSIIWISNLFLKADAKQNCLSWPNSGESVKM